MEVRVTLRGRETVSLTLQPGDTVPELKQQIHNVRTETPAGQNCINYTILYNLVYIYIY